MTTNAAAPTETGPAPGAALLDEDGFVAFLAEALAAAPRTPRYERLIATIEAAVRAGRLPPGAVLPREPDLAARLGLSRQTVGRALNDLARRGLLTRRRGIGTFVAAPPVEHPLGRLASFVRTLAVDGRPPASHLLGIRLTVDPDASPRLTGDAAGTVCEIDRLFRAGGEPFALERVYLRPADAARLSPERLAGGVVYDLLREACGIAVTRGEETLRLARLDRAEAALLGATPDDPAFLVLRVAYAGDRPVEVRRSLVRGDRAAFRIDATGPHPAAVADLLPPSA
jgi:GntR family transcriptional regulator